MAKKDWMVSQADLDDDQLRVLQAVLNKSCIVTGCAGSGKSVLALLKAQRIQKEKGDDYQIIVFTKSLCKYMNMGRESLGLSPQVREYHYQKVSNSDEFVVVKKASFLYYWEWKNNLNIESSQSQYVIVDEIQDFSKDEIQEFVSATKGSFFFFGDTAQSLYSGLKTDIIPVERITSLPCVANKNFKTFELYRNYRLPLPVAHAAYYINLEDQDAFDETIYKSKETAVPFLWKFSDLDSQISQIAQILKNDSSKTDVAILLSRNTDVEIVSNLLGEKGIVVECKYQYKDNQGFTHSANTLDFNTTSPKVMTYHSAKGLQFETVFIPDIQPLDSKHPESDQRALYVAMTRTYRYLYLMYSDYLPEPLSDVPSDLFRCRTFEAEIDITSGECDLPF